MLNGVIPDLRVCGSIESKIEEMAGFMSPGNQELR
jgi:hypothetical protein